MYAEREERRTMNVPLDERRGNEGLFEARNNESIANTRKAIVTG